MMNENAVKLAAALLKQFGQISVSEIRALPFVRSDEEAMIIAKSLAEAFDVEIRQVRQDGHDLNNWVDVLRLNSAVQQLPSTHSTTSSSRQ